MKHYVKNLYTFSQDNPVPKFMAQREQFTCPFCSQVITVAVQPTVTDWEKVANDYKHQCDRMWADFNLLLQEGGCETILASRVKGLIAKLHNSMKNQKDP